MMTRQQEQRRSWTPEEDNKLKECKLKYPDRSWPGTAMLAGLGRTDKSCWERWNNHLKPGVNKANFSQEEDDTIIRLHSRRGNRWATIAENTLLRGRRPNAIKNRWNNHLKRLEIMSELERHLLTDDDASDHSVRGDDLESLMTELASVIPNVDPNRSPSYSSFPNHQGKYLPHHRKSVKDSFQIIRAYTSNMQILSKSSRQIPPIRMHKPPKISERLVIRQST